jgi:uncharacterized membrane protein
MITDIPLKAIVDCSDGECGEVATLIFNPLNRKLTNVIVKIDDVQYLVPIEKVVDSSPERITIDCTIDELTRMEVFTETRYIMTEMPMTYSHAYYGGMESSVYYMDPYVTMGQQVEVPVEVLHIPEGQKALYRGMEVQATDGDAGQIGELVIDPKEGVITHFTLETGHVLGTTAVTLPLTAVSKVGSEAVFLTLSKADIAKLPALPLKRSYGVTPEGETIEMVAIRFQTSDGAAQKLKNMQEMHRRGTFKLLNTAIFVRDEQGVLSIKESGDMGPKRGSVFGAITGGLMGMVAGPGGMVAGALVGAGVGRGAAKRIDVGFNDEFLQVLGEKLKPGQSALLVLLEHRWLDKYVEYMGDSEEVFSRQTLTDRLVDQLLNPPAE